MEQQGFGHGILTDEFCGSGETDFVELDLYV